MKNGRNVVCLFFTVTSVAVCLLLSGLVNAYMRLRSGTVCVSALSWSADTTNNLFVPRTGCFEINVDVISCIIT